MGYETEPLGAALAAYMYEGTRLWERLREARRILEEGLDEESLYQVRESARITYRRHVVPVAAEPTRVNVEDALPLFIMYASNAAEHAARLDAARRRALTHAVYGVLGSLFDEKREPRGSPLRRGLELLSEIDAGSLAPQDLGAYYSLLFSVLVVVQVYASGVQVIRMSLAPLYGLARESLRLLTA